MYFSNQAKEVTSRWFKELQALIISDVEAIEQESSRFAVYPSDLAPGTFDYKPWKRACDDEDGGGGTMAILKGRVFEKIGVNVSTVYGKFSEEFAKAIPGCEEDPTFWASGISLVAHPRSPHVPAVHMNTRYLVTQKAWFGGGSDLTPCLVNKDDEVLFHTAMKEACDPFNKEYYPRYKEWCDRYFFLQHRKEPRGIGGIFYDNHHSGDFQHDFAFTQSVGKAFRDVYPRIVRRHFKKEWTAQERECQLLKRGRYVEFNLLQDRGTRFGLMTGGNVEGILMSLPPLAAWQ